MEIDVAGKSIEVKSAVAAENNRDPLNERTEKIKELVRLAHHWQMDSLFVQALAHDFAESSLPAHYKPMREFVQEQTLFEEDLGLITRTFDEARAAAKELGGSACPAPRVGAAQ